VGFEPTIPINQGSTFKVMNTAWRGQFQPKKIKRKNRYGRTNYRWVAIPETVRRAIDEWGRECGTTGENALMFSAIGARGRKPLDKPMLPDNWLRLRLYPVANRLGIAFHPTFQVPRRNFSTHGKKEAHPTEMQAQLGHSDIRTTLDIYTQITDPEVARMVNQVTNRILGLGEEVEPDSVQ
jgi:integrase